MICEHRKDEEYLSKEDPSAIPMHVGRGIGSLAYANAFKARAPVEGVVLEVA